MKNQIFASSVALMITLGSSLSFGADLGAVKVAMFGRGPAVDGPAYNRLLRVIGDHVAKGHLNKYIVYGYGDEGGSSFCVELSHLSGRSGQALLVQQLRAIKPNPQTTDYTVAEADECSAR